jgi:translation initiation factor IF-3
LWNIARTFRIRVNRQIRIPEIRLIDEEGNQLGIMPTSKALEMAMERGYDLVEIAPQSRPPVCRIMDFGKYKYELKKKLKQSKKKQHVIHVKEIKFRPKTEEHDYQFKKRHAEEFLGKNDKVKFTVIFRGRELSHKELGERILTRIKEELSDIGVVEKDVSFEGRIMTLIMAPIAGKEKQVKSEGGQAAAEESKEGNDAETEEQ